jgi:hypothetical protein
MSRSLASDCDCKLHHCPECTAPQFKAVGGVLTKPAQGVHLRADRIAPHCQKIIMAPLEYPQAVVGDFENMGPVNFTINPTNPTYFYSQCFENHLQSE